MLLQTEQAFPKRVVKLILIERNIFFSPLTWVSVGWLLSLLLSITFFLLFLIQRDITILSCLLWEMRSTWIQIILGGLLGLFCGICLIPTLQLIRRHPFHVKSVPTYTMILDTSNLKRDLLVPENDLGSLDRLVTIISRDNKKVVYCSEGCEVLFNLGMGKGIVNSWSNNSTLIIFLLGRNKRILFAIKIDKKGPIEYFMGGGKYSFNGFFIRQYDVAVSRTFTVSAPF